jgi:lipoprotein-releasing system ATP-binding protein
MLKLVRGVGLGALVATHNLELASKMDRILQLRDGHIEIV